LKKLTTAYSCRTGYNYSLKKTVMKIRPQINGPIGESYTYNNNLHSMET
jgi:hypothetical protein